MCQPHKNHLTDHIKKENSLKAFQNKLAQNWEK